MRGQAPVPGKRLRDVLRARGYRVALLDEFGTSTTCYLCEHPSKSCAPFRMCRNPRPHRRAAHPEVLRHGLIQCGLCSTGPSDSTGTASESRIRAIFNRDVHACLNMQRIARAALFDRAARPAHLSRSR
ncbi:hypothetical protein T492DRAFT_58721 [Pavlovales sp. CCMP2436]|nr:hypothetical protein T492DRAFT_58721 [Pavlovales sp. CCMP2436]